MPSRRTFLTTGAVIALSGCSAHRSGSARIARIRLEIDDSRAHEVSLTVRIDSEVVYDETHLIAAEERDSAVELTDALPDKRGRITIETAIPESETTESLTFDENSCYDVLAVYTGDNLIHWLSEISDGCDTFTEE